MANTVNDDGSMVVTLADVPAGGPNKCAVCKHGLGKEHDDDCWLGQLHNGRISNVPPGV